MIDSNRVKNIVEQIRSMSAADMKQIARFGKVKNYSQRYIDLKESLRSMMVMARNLHGLTLDEAFEEIEPITFTGMIPNENFNSERRKIADLGERLSEALEKLERTNAPGSAVANGSQQTIDAGTSRVSQEKPVIFISESLSSAAGSDLKRCMTTSDCELSENEERDLSAPHYLPADAAEDMAGCNGAMICLMNPDGPDPDDAEETDDTDRNSAAAIERARIANNALFELGMALGLFPEKTFFVVQNSMVSAIPEAYHDLISFQTSGEKLSFEEGQRMVQMFRQPSWLQS